MLSVYCFFLYIKGLTEIPHVSLGDEVVLMGRQGKEQITAEEIADKIESVSYNVLCSIGKRVPRIDKG